MTWQRTPYLPLLLLSASILTALGVYAWRYRRWRGAVGFMILMFGGTAWALFYGLQLAAADAASKLFWIPFIYVGVLVQPVGYLLLAVQYSGRESRASRRLVVAVSVIQLAVWLLVLTNPLHGAVFRSFELVRHGGFIGMRAEPGAVYLFNVGFSYTVLAVTMVYLVLYAISAPPLYRRQAATLILGWLVPTVGNLVYLFGALPEPRINPTPFLFPLSGAILAVGIFRFRLLNVVPVARATVIEEMADGIIVLDAANRMVDANPAARALLGAAGAEVIGRTAPDALLPFTGGLGDSASGAAFHAARLGDEHFEVHRSSLTDPLDRFVGTLMIVRNVTEAKRTEAALRRATWEAEQANRAKSEFLSRMSHELRTPMNSILGFAQLLAKRELPPEQRRSVDHILKAGQHLLNLINEVLDIARIESDEQEITLESVAVDAVLEETLELIRPLAEEEQCALPDAVPCGGLCVRADRRRLVQIVLNLLSNAVKYNRPGGRVDVSCELNGERVRIGVHDTGPGIAPEKVGQLFLPFTRLGAEYSGVQGTGLGLTLSKRLTEAMGGELGVRTEPGAGSSFWVELPRADDFPQPLAGAGNRATGRQAQPTARRRALLYIEDNAANLDLVQSVLAERPDLEVLPAARGELGLRLAHEHLPALILLDLHLPDLSGEEVLRQLRADPHTREIPVVVISADAMPATIDRLERGGACAYLPKPLDLDEFLALVDEVLERGG